MRRLDPSFAQSPARFVVNYLRGVQRDLRFVRRYGRPWRSVVRLVPQHFVEVYGTYRGVKASAEIRRGGFRPGGRPTDLRLLDAVASRTRPRALAVADVPA